MENENKLTVSEMTAGPLVTPELKTGNSYPVLIVTKSFLKYPDKSLFFNGCNRKCCFRGNDTVGDFAGMDSLERMVVPSGDSGRGQQAEIGQTFVGRDRAAWPWADTHVGRALYFRREEAMGEQCTPSHDERIWPARGKFSRRGSWRRCAHYGFRPEARTFGVRHAASAPCKTMGLRHVAQLWLAQLLHMFNLGRLRGEKGWTLSEVLKRFHGDEKSLWPARQWARVF
nr:hypothetical protein Iba_chr01bCG19490 [Ipomoea batatas]